MAHVAREFGLALLVDATFASPINFRPLEHGADVVITSATKYLNGHSDVIAGAVAGSTSFVEEVNRLMRLWGQAIDPHAAWLVDRGHAHARAPDGAAQRQRRWRSPRWAAKHAGIRAGPLSRAGRPPRPRRLPPRLLDGFGGMVGLELAGGAKAARAPAHPAQAGHPRAEPRRRRDAWSREPRLTSHKGLSAEERAALGIPDGFLRLSCGIEDADDIIADLEEALGKG